LSAESPVPTRLRPTLMVSFLWAVVSGAPDGLPGRIVVGEAHTLVPGKKEF
jgi:hypothetical protein